MNLIPNSNWLNILRALLFSLLFVWQSNVIAQVESETTIIYTDQSLRDIAAKYLGDPNYWDVILLYNNLADITELEPGISLKIPTGLVAATLEEIANAKEKIGNAKKEGAKVLTPGLITEAEKEFEKVLVLKQQGEWKEAYDTLQDVLRLATESLEQVKVLRESSADATISFTKGEVQKRKPREKLWSEAELYAKLYEADRARTMEDSFAEITFIDLSRIRLNENSQALIQHSRVDVLKNKTETKVKLIKGDAFAYLLNSPKKKFDIDVPGLDAKIMSRSFWIEKETVSTKIANFDGEIELSALDSVVVVKENQGSIIPTGGVPSKPQNLLPSPVLVLPENLSKFFDNQILFNWESVNNANKYWFELAKDASFQNLVYSNKYIQETSVEVKDLSAGVYYWHVCSVDKQGFPGDFSRYSYLMVVNDDSLPFLVVKTPSNRFVTKGNMLVVSGETEIGVNITINNIPANVGSNGEFERQLKLNQSINNILIKAVGENGKSFEIYKTVYYESSPEVENEILSKTFDQTTGKFIINSNRLNLIGKTRVLSNVSVLSNGREVRTTADTLGSYSLDAEIGNSDNIKLLIATPAGYTKSNDYPVIFDNVPPVLTIDTNVPRLTSKSSITIVGKVSEAEMLLINSQPVKIENGLFNKTVNLSEGQNTISIKAVDNAENISEEKFGVFKDGQAPELVDSWVEQVRKGEYLIRIKVSDASGLKKTAKANLSINNIDQEVILLYNSNYSEYFKIIYLNNNSKNIKLKSVKLEDYLENSKEYYIQK